MDPTRVLPQVSVEVKEDLTLEVKPIRILDWGVKEHRIRRFPSSGSYGGVLK